MNQEEKYVWYASYGSNLLEERFLCYIRGGRPSGSSQMHEGCRDKSPPIRKQAISITHQLYFARHSSSWGNGGVAFVKIKSNPQISTLGRMYLITLQQFIDVIKQENDFYESPQIDFDKASRDGSLIFEETEWYGNLIHLGIHSDYPVFTFTNAVDLIPTTKPANSYIETIARGLRETYPKISNGELVEYLLNKLGIADNFSSDDLYDIIGH